MAEPITNVEFVDAYDKTTGEKLANQVPRSWVEEGSPFPHLSATPRQRDADARAQPLVDLRRADA